LTTPDVLAVYFPSYHPDRHYAQWYGEGFSEWELLRRTRPLFDGHAQPLECEWGPFDESDPAWMARQIDLAADHGITAFLFDWYWYEGEQFLEAALERGFLAAPNRDRLKFCVMWANHTWGVWPAAREIYLGRQSGGPTADGQALAYDAPLLEIRHSAADTDRVVDYCAEHYFGRPNYLTIAGRPVFAIWYPLAIEQQLGGVEAVGELFARMKDRARSRGFAGLHITVNIANVEGGPHCWRPDFVERYAACGADSTFGYNAARTQSYPDLTDDWPVVRYDEVIESHVELFGLCEDRGLPFCPVATVGFDNTPRWHQGASLPVEFRKLHYEPIVTGSTPERFGRLVREGLACIRRQGGDNPFLLINAWNEWTEGCYLLPERRTGTGCLEALRRELERNRR